VSGAPWLGARALPCLEALVALARHLGWQNPDVLRLDSRSPSHTTDGVADAPPRTVHRLAASADPMYEESVNDSSAGEVQPRDRAKARNQPTCSVRGLATGTSFAPGNRTVPVNDGVSESNHGHARSARSCSISSSPGGSTLTEASHGSGASATGALDELRLPFRSAVRRRAFRRVTGSPMTSSPSPLTVSSPSPRLRSPSA
jgi:hypothetical protein